MCLYIRRRANFAERDIHDAGNVSVLRTLHDTLDREVADAYGWRPDLSAPEIVARIVALNAERRAEMLETLTALGQAHKAADGTYYAQPRNADEIRASPIRARPNQSVSSDPEAAPNKSLAEVPTPPV